MIKSGTRVLQAMGEPSAHPLAALMQNAALKESGINAVYATDHTPVEKVGEALAVMRVLDFLGANCAIPFKEKVVPHLDELEETARLVGAVNTIVNRDGKLCGYNTDVHGIGATIKQDLGFDPQDKSIILLGANSTCRAAIVALCKAGARHIAIADHCSEQAQTLTVYFSKIFPQTYFEQLPLNHMEMSATLSEANLLINMLSADLTADYVDNFPWRDLNPQAAVLDFTCSATDTLFVAAAKAHHHPAIGGLELIKTQGEKDFELWTGSVPAKGLMQSCLNNVCAKGKH